MKLKKLLAMLLVLSSFFIFIFGVGNTAFGAEAITLTWSHKKPLHVHGFNIYYKTERNAEWELIITRTNQELNLNILCNGTDCVYEHDPVLSGDLETDTIYYFAIQAYNSAGVSKLSHTLKVKWIEDKWYDWIMRVPISVYYLLFLKEE